MRFLAAFLALLALAAPAWADDFGLLGVSRSDALVNTYNQQGVYGDQFTTFYTTCTTGAQTTPCTVANGNLPAGLTDSQKGIIAFSIRSNAGYSGYSFIPPTINPTQVIGNKSLVGTGVAGAAQTCESVAGFSICNDTINGYGTLRLNLNDQTTGTQTSLRSALATVPANARMVPMVWAHYIFSFDTSVSPGLVAIYKDGVKVNEGFDVMSNANPITVNVANPAGFALGWAGNYQQTNNVSSGTPSQFELADVFIDFTNNGNLTHNNTTNHNDIDAGVLARFFSGGKPVDLDQGTGDTKCKGPLGVQPQFCLRGPKDSFFTNKGWLDLSGKMTIGNQASAYGVAGFPMPWDSPVSQPNPAPAGRATVQWVAQGGASSTATVTAKPDGRTIADGDLMLIFLDVVDGAGAQTHNPQCPGPDAGLNAWTSYFTYRTGLGTYNSETLVCYKFAKAAYDACQVVGGVNTGPGCGGWALNWTTNAGRGSTWTMLDIVGANTTMPIDQFANSFASSATVTTPSVNGTAGETLLRVYMPATSTPTLKPASTESVMIRCGIGGNSPCMMVTFNYLSATGATGTLSATSSSSFPYQSFSLTLKPQ